MKSKSLNLVMLSLSFIIFTLLLSLPTSQASWLQDPVHITGFSVDSLDEHEGDVDFHYEARRLHIKGRRGIQVLLRFYGKFTPSTYLSLSNDRRCNRSKTTKEQKVNIIDGSNGTAAEMQLDTSLIEGVAYFCLRLGSWQSPKVQGGYTSPKGKPAVHSWLSLLVFPPDSILYQILTYLSILALLFLSALFSGLNLGLLSLEKTDLKIIINTGSQRERSHASRIVPVRNHGNYLLCTLLLSNVLVNTYLTLLLDHTLGTHLKTLLLTTLMIVIFGEIVPQAVCSRYGLTVGAKTIWITKLFMFISFPIAYPMGRVLDKILGEEIGAVYTRDRLKELLKVTRDQHGLETDEVGIISGTLDMKKKTVKEVMTPIQEMFMIPYDAVLDKEMLIMIEKTGYTRIPVYEGERENVVGLLNVKNLALRIMKHDQNRLVKDEIDLSKPLFYVFENTRLDYMLKTFIEGSRGHMAFVERINDEGPGDPKNETVGLVTLEDVLEEILQAEIYDENDVVRGRVENLSQPQLAIGKVQLQHLEQIAKSAKTNQAS